MEVTERKVISRTCDMCLETQFSPDMTIREFIFSVTEFDGHRNGEAFKSLHLCKKCQQKLYLSISGGLMS